jgi:hypothetical protein
MRKINLSPEIGEDQGGSRLHPGHGPGSIPDSGEGPANPIGKHGENIE